VTDRELPRIEWVGEQPEPELLKRWIEAHQLVDDEELDEWRAESDAD
jgi:hypothetical protein